MDRGSEGEERLADSSITTSKTQDGKSTVTEQSESLHVTNAPDPDEDNLDDLDDMLEEFSATGRGDSNIAPRSPLPSRVSKEISAEDPLTALGVAEKDFAKQLQEGMANLLGELETSPDVQVQFESMLKELESVGNLGATTEQASDSGSTQAFSTTNKATSSTGGEDSFQETIRRTIERMQVSGEQATAAAVADDSNDILTELMKQMQTEGLDGEGNEEELSKMLLGMMEQLTNKDILYEPMKELNDKFPEWIDKNRATVPIEDMKRYEEQRKVVYEIVAKFEEKTYADSNVADREYIVDRMQKMQTAGSPPPDLVGDMASAQEALGVSGEGCPQQ